MTGPGPGPGRGSADAGGGSSDCTYADLLSAYVDDELTGPERARLERHLLVHADCRRELEDVTEVRAAVRALPWIDGPAEFWSELAVESSLAGAPDAPSATRRISGAHVSRWLWGSAAAAFLLVAAGMAGTQVDHASTTASDDAPSISTARVGAEPMVTSISAGPAVGQQLVAHNDGMDDAMDGVASFLRMP